MSHRDAHNHLILLGPGKEICKAKIRPEHYFRVEEHTACSNTDTICKSCGVAKSKASQVPQTQQGHFETAIKSLNCPKHSADTPLASHGCRRLPARVLRRVLRMWHLAWGMRNNHKGSRTSKIEELRRLADMENFT